MLTETLHRRCPGTQFVADFPLEPIKEECSYKKAIAILDRLFHLGRDKTCEETEYFKALAQIAYEYECNTI